MHIPDGLLHARAGRNQGLFPAVLAGRVLGDSAGPLPYRLHDAAAALGRRNPAHWPR